MTHSKRLYTIGNNKKKNRLARHSITICYLLMTLTSRRKQKKTYKLTKILRGGGKCYRELRQNTHRDRTDEKANHDCVTRNSCGHYRTQFRRHAAITLNPAIPAIIVSY